MVRILEKESEPQRQRRPRLTEGQVKTLARTTMKMIGIVVAEQPKPTAALLRHFKVRLPHQPKDEDLIESIMSKIADQDTHFNKALGDLIASTVPQVDPREEFDHFSEDATAAKDVVGGAAAGAMGGGIWGAAIGTIGGIFNFATTSKQQKIEEERASAMSLASLVQYKTAKEQNKGLVQSTTAKIVIAVIIVAGLVGSAYLIIKHQKNKASVQEGATV